MRIKYLFVSFFLLLSLCAGAYQSNNAVSVSIVSESSVVTAKPFKVGILVDIPDGMHIYWKNPGETGFPLNIEWILPEGLSIIHEDWPAPEILRDGVVYFGYTGKVFITADIFVPENMKDIASLPISAKIDWLACSESCFPGSAIVNIDIPFSNYEADEVVFESIFESSSYKFPRPLSIENHENVDIRYDNNMCSITFSSVDMKDIKKVNFIPADMDLDIDYNDFGRFIIEDTSSTLFFKTHTDAMINKENISGILLIEREMGDTYSISINQPIFKAILQESGFNEGAKQERFIETNEISSSFILILIFAFCGGLLLNIMPCVLPLITLKVYNLINTAKESQSSRIKHALGFTSGVIACFWALALISSILRFIGKSAGWGFQLQEPMFVVILITVLFIFALGSLGVFEFGAMMPSVGGCVVTGKRKFLAAFANGVLATILTTPCTGPFLGSVIGMIISISIWKQFLVFSLIGFGMALPYLLFSIYPAMMKILPRSGNWMIIFKQITGFLMMATVVWLIWVFGAQTSTTAVVIMLFGLLFASVGAWCFGYFSNPLLKLKMKRLGFIFAYIFMALAIATSILSTRIESSQEDTQLIASRNSNIEPFSIDRLNELRASGVTVFVNFTAKWCLTCQVNKPLLHSNEFSAFLKDKNIVFMEADWTKKDASIGNEIARLGRAGVPLYVLYVGDTVEILPQALTMGIVDTAIRSVYKRAAV